MIKYKLRVGGAPITSIQYKGAPIGHLHYKGTPYSYWENPPPEPEPEPPAPPKPLTIYRLTGDSVGMTRVTFNVAGSNYYDLQVGIKASGYNYFAFQRQLDRGVWINESSGTPASMGAGDKNPPPLIKGHLVPDYPETSSTPPVVTGEYYPSVLLTVTWVGRRGSPALVFKIQHRVKGYYFTVDMLTYNATATFNENGECVSAQDTFYHSETEGNSKTNAQRPTLTRSGASFRVRDGAWVRLLKVSG